MSIYILIDYVEECFSKGVEPTFQGLHQFKRKKYNYGTIK